MDRLRPLKIGMFHFELDKLLKLWSYILCKLWMPSKSNIDWIDCVILMFGFRSALFFFSLCSSLDYDDDRYYIANNLRNSHYALHPNPSPVQNPYVQKPSVVTNYPSNRLLSQMKRTSLTGSPTDPKQDVGLPRSSIVWTFTNWEFETKLIKFLRNEMNVYQRVTSPMKSNTHTPTKHKYYDYMHMLNLV